MSAAVIEAAPRSVQEVGLDLYDAGLCVLAASGDGSKRPAVNWKAYQTVRPSREETIAMLAGAEGFGVVCGAVSDGLIMVELEARGIHLLADLDTTACASDLKSVLDRVVFGYAEGTPSGGCHFLLRTTGTVPGNLKLARNEAGEVLAETRGEGGWVVVSPSAGTTHPTGKPWRMLFGGASSIATVTADELADLLDLFRSLDAYRPHVEPPRLALVPPLPDPFGPAVSTAATSTGISPGDDYANRTTWADVLQPHGWTFVYTASDGRSYWRRPGKDEGISASTGGAADGVDRLFVFSTSAAPFEIETPYSKFAAITALEHGGDFSAAARALSATGYGDKWAEMHTQVEDTADGSAPEPIFVDVAAMFAGGLPDAPEPVFMRRDDGVSLFYAAKVNILFGDPESGKSWIAYAAAVQALQDGHRAAIVDVDHNGARDVLARLMALGASVEALSDPAMFRLAEPEDGLSLVEVVAALRAWAPALVVVDSIGEILPMLGLSSNSPDDYTAAHRRVLTALTGSGAAVVAIDHLPKSDDAREHGQTGTMAKRRAVNGVSLRVTLVQTFAPGRGGAASLTIHKDRPGGLRGRCPVVGKHQPAGRFVMSPQPDGSLSWHVTQPLTVDVVAGPSRPDDVAEVDALDPEPRGVRDVMDRCSWGYTRAKDALEGWREHRAPSGLGGVLGDE